MTHHGDHAAGQRDKERDREKKCHERDVARDREAVNGEALRQPPEVSQTASADGRDDAGNC